MGLSASLFPAADTSMVITDPNPLALFLTLDYFSRFYFAGVLCTAIWSGKIFVQIMKGIRREGHKTESFDENAHLNLARMQNSLHSLESFAMVLTSGCCVNQIFGVWFTYMARVTDANPFMALREAWTVSQTLVCLLVLIDALRRISLATLERHRFKSPAEMSHHD